MSASNRSLYRIVVRVLLVARALAAGLRSGNVGTVSPWRRLRRSGPAASGVFGPGAMRVHLLAACVFVAACPGRAVLGRGDGSPDVVPPGSDVSDADALAPPDDASPCNVPMRIPPPGGARVIQIATAGGSTAALLDDGSIWSWGRTYERNPSDPPPARPVRLESFPPSLQIALGESNLCAVAADHRVLCTGSCGFGICQGGGAHRGPYFVGVLNAAEVEVGLQRQACARLRDGSVTCWGTIAGAEQAPRPVPSITTAAQLAVNDYMACVRTESARVICWGDDAPGDPDWVPSLHGVVDLIAHQSGFVARTSDGRFFGTHGRLWTLPSGTGWFPVSDPVLSGGTWGLCARRDATMVAVADDHVCVLRRDGGLVCWGEDQYGQLGDGIDAWQPTPQRVPLEAAAIQLASGGGLHCALLADGTVACWGRTERWPDLPLARPTRAPGIERATQLSVDRYSVCARIEDGTVRCWGGALDGRLHMTRPSSLPLAHVAQIEVGDILCARFDDGSVACWGDNALGQLGDGTTLARDAPGPRVLGIHDAVDLTVSRDLACAQLRDRSVWCWGRDSHGQLGDGGTGISTHPVHAVRLDGLHDLVATNADVCGIDERNRVVCTSNWSGGWPYGQVSALGETWEGNQSYGTARCVVLPDGSVQCMGPNHYGMIGDGSFTNRNAPVAVTGLADVAEVTPAVLSTCARTLDGSVYCWGWDGDGALGDGLVTLRTTPTSVEW